MFLGSFSWDKNGLCYVWKPETLAERTAAQAKIDILNTKNEPHCEAE